VVEIRRRHQYYTVLTLLPWQSGLCLSGPLPTDSQHARPLHSAGGDADGVAHADKDTTDDAAAAVKEEERMSMMP
jgi:hypothetical protein